jgi:KDO2-lipid IV(A) lauroyltransferase
MDYPLYLLLLLVVKCLQALPLRMAARLGRFCGGLAYILDFKHRRVALTNLTAIFSSSKDEKAIRKLARENFRRLGENYCTAVKTAGMTSEQISRHVTITGLEKLSNESLPPSSRVVAIGHFGNFELYTRIAWGLPDFKGATTFRALNQPHLNKLLLRLRLGSGILLFERRTGMKDLQKALHDYNLCLGLLSDQKAGRTGVLGPFLGHNCSTSTAPVILSLRYDLPLFTAICYRTDLAQWHIEIGDQIPTLENGQRRPVEDLVHDVNKVLEKAVLRDPANWFWVHDRWKFNEKPAQSRRKPKRRKRPMRRRQSPGQDTPKS